MKEIVRFTSLININASEPSLIYIYLSLMLIVNTLAFHTI
jgi:hypothetical protein